jgi:iron complex transport system substrate-binding protein
LELGLYCETQFQIPNSQFLLLNESSMKKICIIVIIALAVSACGRFGNKEVDGTKDMRIVCLSKHLTEMVFALGKGHDIVACDLSSTYPDSAKLLKTVGYHRALNPEGIISMNPDLVIHSNDIGPESVLPQITKAGLNIKVFGGANTIDSAKLLLGELGKFFGESAKADSLIKKVDAGVEEAKARLTALNAKDTPSVMIIHFGRANNVYFVMSGRNGVGDKMIAMAGGKTAKYDAKGARQISAEAVATANPDVIIATDYGFDQMGSAEKFKTVPGVALTNAAKNNRIYRFEEHDLIYFGPRTGDNVINLMNLLHPTTNAPKQ